MGLALVVALPSGGRVRAQRRRLREALELVAPEGLVLFEVLLEGPLDEVPVVRRRLELRLLVARVGRVECEDLAGENRLGPTVENDVVVADDECIGILAVADDDAAQQWRFIQREAAASIRLANFGHAGVLGLGSEITQVVGLEGKSDSAVNDLERLGQVFPDDRRA
jgi:hypothetical protein